MKEVDYVMALSLVFSAYTLTTCPCETPCECKYTRFLLSAGIPLAYVVLTNKPFKYTFSSIFNGSNSL